MGKLCDDRLEELGLSEEYGIPSYMYPMIWFTSVFHHITCHNGTIMSAQLTVYIESSITFRISMISIEKLLIKLDGSGPKLFKFFWNLTKFYTVAAPPPPSTRILAFVDAIKRLSQWLHSGAEQGWDNME